MTVMPSHTVTKCNLMLVVLLLLLSSANTSANNTVPTRYQYLFSWGRNEHKQLIDGRASTRSVLYKITPPANKSIAQATVGNQNTFLITTDDEMYCTGWNTYGQCGLGHTNEVNEPKKLDTSGLLVSGIKSITTGQYHTMVLTKQNQVIAWGRNRFGGLGDGTTIDRDTPTLVDFGNLQIDSIHIANEYTLLLVQGKVYAMGANDNGQLGDGTNHYKTTPVPVYTAGVLRGKSIIKLSGHSETITALTKDQKVISWGCGANGRLGNGNVRDSNVPVLVKTDGALKGKIVVDIAGAAWSTSCLTSDNKLFSWGYNVFGALGDGTFTDSAVPVPVNDLYNYLAGKTIIGIHPGYFYTLIQTSDYLYGYGHNQYSQLGDGTSQYSYSYIVRVDAANKLAGLNVTSVHCGHHNIVTAENGSAPFYQPLRVVRSSGLGLFENKSITVVKAILLIAFVQYLIQG